MATVEHTVKQQSVGTELQLDLDENDSDDVHISDSENPTMRNFAFPIEGDAVLAEVGDSQWIPSVLVNFFVELAEIEEEVKL